MDDQVKSLERKFELQSLENNKKFEDIMQLLKKLSVSTESQNKDSSSDSSAIGIATGPVTVEVVAGSAVWLGKGLPCVCARRRDSDSRLSFDLTPAEIQSTCIFAANALFNLRCSREVCLQRLQNRIDVPYDTSLPEHQEALRALWDAAFPEEELHDLVSEQWKKMGWQEKDPSTALDLSGGGYVSSENLLYSAMSFPEVCLQRLQSRIDVPYDTSLPEHQEALRALQDAAFPEEELQDLVSVQWKDLRWQGKDPSTDLSGGGCITLENLYFARNFPKSFLVLLRMQEGDTWEYIFSVAGVDITSMLIQMLDLEAAEVVIGSATWLGNGLLCVCGQIGDSDSRFSLDLTPAEKVCLQRLHNRIDVPYDTSLLERQEALRALWDAAFPEEELHDLVSEQWKKMGWQEKDPSTDLSGSGGGYVSSENLLYSAMSFPKSFLFLLRMQEGDTWEYIFSVAGVDITSMLIQMLDLEAAEVVIGSATWLGKGLLCVCGQIGDSDSRFSLDLIPAEKVCLQRLHNRIDVPYDTSLLERQEALRALWDAAFPEEELHDLVSEQWKKMGWQEKDPSTDLSGGGYVSSENLLYSAMSFPKSFQVLLRKQGSDGAMWEYPFAVSGVNITSMLIQMLDPEAAEVVVGSAAWLEECLSCVYAQIRDSDSRLPFDLTPAEPRSTSGTPLQMDSWGSTTLILERLERGR